VSVDTATDFVRIFDTTLRDGEQSPGASLTAGQKVEMAHQLDRMGVDVMEAGFPAASPGDLESVEMISRAVEYAQVAALARCVAADIESAAWALRPARRPVLHVFVATSDIHLKHKLRISREEVIEQIRETVRLARNLCPEVEFSAEDATRTEWDFLARACRVAVDAGARTINLPDTVGYVLPDEYAAMFRHIQQQGDWPDDLVFSAHCHDDLGLATANTIAAIQAGVRQVEVTVNGLGERAGNAPVEEVVMALKTRGHSLNLPQTRVDTRELVPSSQLMARLTGLHVQANKAVVGINAFAHEAGIHQDGFIKERSTYEIMLPEDVGWASSRLVLGKHSGRHGVAYRLTQLGYDLDKQSLQAAYDRFIELADRQKTIEDEDLHALVGQLGEEKPNPLAIAV
jgi:2-isopropylmalate synthase